MKTEGYTMDKLKLCWIVGSYLPKEVSDYFGLQRIHSGGWLQDYYKRLSTENDIELLVISFSSKISSIKSEKFGNSIFYILPKGTFINFENVSKSAINVILKFNPKLIHLHGTEFKHAGRIVLSKELSNHKLFVTIQGLPGKISNSFTSGIQFKNTFYKLRMWFDFWFLKCYFYSIYTRERLIILKADYYSGRTFWDYAYLKSINPSGKYIRHNYNLRSEFYTSIKWDESKIAKKKIYVSSLLPSYKGFHHIINVISKLNQIYPDLEVVVPKGSFNPLFVSSYEKYLLREIGNLGLSSTVRIESSMSVDSVIDEMLSSNVVIIPSQVENASATLCEAQYLGVPIIAAFTGGMTELFHHEESGFYFNLKDEDVLFQRTLELFENSKLSIQFSKQGILLAQKRHDKDKNYRELIDIYKGIIVGK